MMLALLGTFFVLSIPTGKSILDSLRVAVTRMTCEIKRTLRKDLRNKMIMERECYPEERPEIGHTVGKKMQNGQGKNALCPNIRNPFDDCYCVSTSSMYAEATIHYCGGGYKDCEIYAKHSAEEGKNI